MDIVIGLIAGIGIGSLLSLPLVIFSDQIFDWIGDRAYDLKQLFFSLTR